MNPSASSDPDLPVLLRSIPNIGDSKTPALYETLFRSLFLQYRTEDAPRVTRSDVSLFPYLQMLFADEKTERAALLLFDAHGVLLGTRTVGYGTENEAELDLFHCLDGIDPKSISTALLVHNHPNGVSALSDADRETAERISAAFRYTRIRLDRQMILSGSFCREYSISESDIR